MSNNPRRINIAFEILLIKQLIHRLKMREGHREAGTYTKGGSGLEVRSVLWDLREYGGVTGRQVHSW